MTSTMNEMKTVIDSLEKAGLRSSLLVIIGGRPVNDEFSNEIGADGYAEDAVKMGLANKAFPDDALMAGAREWGLRLAAGPSLTLGTLKLGMRRSLDSSISDVLHWEVMMQSLVLQTQDAREGFKALLEKRKPKFEGK